MEQVEVSILAFSIGGTIAWKAALKGLKIKSLWAFSATRLRYEVERPNIPIQLFFGQKDEYRPSSNWFDRREIEY
ncbi:MAG: alpha/beta hydrolase, partial [Bacteroidota bacterium]